MSVASAEAASPIQSQILPVEGTNHADLRALLIYWHRLCDDKELPARPDELTSIGRLLGGIYICDVVDNGENFRFYLLGGNVFQGLCESQSDGFLADHPYVSVRIRFPVLFGEVVRSRKPVRGLAIYVTGNVTVRAESILLPFGMGEVTQVMGFTVLSTPDRFLS